MELINYRKDGSAYWVDVNFVPITDERGEFTHWVAVQRETTHRKQAEDLERDRNRVLELVARNEPLESVLGAPGADGGTPVPGPALFRSAAARRATDSGRRREAARRRAGASCRRRSGRPELGAPRLRTATGKCCPGRHSGASWSRADPVRIRRRCWERSPFSAA